MHLRPTDPALRPPGAGPLASGPLVDASAVPLVRVPAVRPVASAPNSTTGSLSEASRAGIDLVALLAGGEDSLVARERPTAVALAMVLERARAALVRGDAGDALAALDDAWEGAMRTESGWYLRSSALAVLGLPGEAERVLQQALVPRGGSVALLFLQSIVRSALGDTPGARESLLAAEARRPLEPVLLAWRAVLTARSGDRAGAQQQLADIPPASGQTALLTWARQAVVAANADASRLVHQAPSDIATEHDEAPGMLPPMQTVSEPTRDSLSPVLLPMQDGLRKIGAELVTGTPPQIRSAVRAFLQSLATGGTLDRVARPQQVPALRSVLASLLAVMQPRPEAPPVGRSFDARTDPNGSWRVMPESASPPELAPPHRAVRTAALESLWRGDLRAAELALPRVASAEGDVVATAIRFLIDGARRQWGDRAPVAEAPSQPRDANRPFDSLLTPIRAGLSLLQQPSSPQASSQQSVQLSLHQPSDHSPTQSSLERPHWSSQASTQPPPYQSAQQQATLSHAIAAAPLTPELGAMPMGAGAVEPADVLAAAQLFAIPARQVNTGSGRDDRPGDGSNRDTPSLADAFRSGQRMRALALVCMALAFAAMVYGQGIVAIALAGGASWLALRSSSVAAAARASERDTPDESSR